METILTVLSIPGGIASVLIVFITIKYAITGENFIFKKEKKTEEDTVSCNTCKCLLNKSDSYIVMNKNSFYGMHLYEVECQKEYFESFYCQKCKPNYTKILDTGYYKELQVDINGEPIGYKKK